jgi:dTDP-glucose 4,6-dehydratase
MAAFRPKSVLLTGGAGFIGSNLTRAVLDMVDAQPTLESVVVFDALTYAGHRVNLSDVEHDPRFAFVEGDICDRSAVEKVIADSLLYGRYLLQLAIEAR